MIRTCLPMAIGLTLLTALALHAGVEGDGEGPPMPTIDLDMLVFTDQAHLDAVLSDLIARQEALDATLFSDEGDGGGDDGYDHREAAVFQDFAHAIGFESLLIRLEAETRRLEAAGGFDDASDPDNHHVADPYFRGLLNPQAEIWIGDTIYRHHPNGTYEITGRHADILGQIRQGLPIETNEDVAFRAHFRGPECCRGTWFQKEIHLLPNGTRRLKTKKWIDNYAWGASLGAMTISQRRGQYGWKRTRADRIGVRGSVLKTDNECTIEALDEFNVDRSNKRRAEASLPPIPLKRSLRAKDFFDTTHWVEDDGESLSVTLSMCDCRAAVATFSLPETADDLTSVVLDGTASVDEDRYFLEVYPTDAVGSDTVAGPYWSQWFSGPVGAVNLADHYSFSDAIGTANVYRVKLAVQNGCTEWDEEVQWVTVLDPRVHVTYRAHVKSLGWLDWVHSGETAGTTGEHRRMEAAQIKLLNEDPGMRICYRAHVEGHGWLGEACDGATGGTTGEARRMEAIRIRLVNPPAGCEVEYRAHSVDYGWLDWVRNGAVAGTTGEARRMEALEVRLVGCG